MSEQSPRLALTPLFRQVERQIDSYVKERLKQLRLDLSVLDSASETSDPFRGRSNSDAECAEKAAVQLLFACIELAFDGYSDNAHLTLRGDPQAQTMTPAVTRQVAKALSSRMQSLQSDYIRPLAKQVKEDLLASDLSVPESEYWQSHSQYLLDLMVRAIFRHSTISFTGAHLGIWYRSLCRLSLYFSDYQSALDEPLNYSKLLPSALIEKGQLSSQLSSNLPSHSLEADELWASALHPRPARSELGCLLIDAVLYTLEQRICESAEYSLLELRYDFKLSIENAHRHQYSHPVLDLICFIGMLSFLELSEPYYQPLRRQINEALLAFQRNRALLPTHWPRRAVQTRSTDYTSQLYVMMQFIDAPQSARLVAETAPVLADLALTYQARQGVVLDISRAIVDECGAVGEAGYEMFYSFADRIEAARHSRKLHAR